jgi:periplasmic divalent cation tolerance protein
MIYIIWACANLEEAQKIARSLIEKRLIACASFIPEVTSIYRWEGEIAESKEVKVLLKTQEEFFNEIRDYILKSGSYQVPEISAIKVDLVNPAYLQWLNEVTLQ